MTSTPERTETSYKGRTIVIEYREVDKQVYVNDIEYRSFQASDASILRTTQQGIDEEAEHKRQSHTPADYHGRTITIESAGGISRDDNLFDDYPHSRNEFKRVVVNGAAQFSFQGDDRFVLAETQRYIDAVDMAAERSRQKFAAGTYTSGRNTDFAESWKAA